MSQRTSQGRKPHIPPAPKPKKHHSIWFYLMLVVLFGALVPVLYRMGALPNQAERRLALI